MFLFKACPRCGGDVDARFYDDVFCVQCAYRPKVAYPGPRIVEAPRRELEELRRAKGHEAASKTGAPEITSAADGKMVCPRCGSADAAELDRLRTQDNACYRCYPCGYIFSPGTAMPHDARGATPR